MAEEASLSEANEPCRQYDHAREVERLASQVQRLARARAAMQRELEADQPAPVEPGSAPSVELFTAITSANDSASSYCRVNMGNKVRYLERAMGYSTEGLLWASVASAAPRKLATGGTEYALRFPRPAYFDERLPFTRDGKELPPGHYDGTISLTLSNPNWAPCCGYDLPTFTSRQDLPLFCKITLVLESLRPIAMPAQESGLALTWAQFKASLREAFLPNGGDVFFSSGLGLL